MNENNKNFINKKFWNKTSIYKIKNNKNIFDQNLPEQKLKTTINSYETLFLNFNNLSNRNKKSFTKKLKISNSLPRQFRILSIDGGGMKGYFTAYALKILKEEFNIDILDYFDLVVGTSTGALIISSLLIKEDPAQIYNQYNTSSQYLFSRLKLIETLKKPLFPQYSNTNLQQNLNLLFRDMTLIDLYNISKKSFLFTATNYNEGKPVIFGSPNFTTLNPLYSRYKVKHALLASSAAPFYFEPQKDKITGDWIIDGGLWSNNPVNVGIMYAISDLKININDISVLSFGQTFLEDMNFKPRTGVDVFRNIRENELTILYSATLMAQMNFTNLFVSSILGERFLRYSPEIPILDSKTDTISSEFRIYAHNYFEKNKSYILSFLKDGINKNYSNDIKNRYN